jgi:bifunctional non-homologous end joining protein LigD
MPLKNKRAARNVARPSPERGLPGFFEPMAPKLVDELPDDRDEWLYELKLDGYRALLRKDGASVRLISRNDKDLSGMYPGIVTAGRRLNAERAIVDGEIVAVDQMGRPSFQALQHRSAHPKHIIVFVAFDLPYVDGKDLMADTIEERRATLEEVIGDSGVLFSQNLPGAVSDIVRVVRERRLEGVVAKRKGSTYVPGDRTRDWLKLKLERMQEFVIGGFRPNTAGIDAVLVGYYEAGKLRFAGKVRAGFVSHSRHELINKLNPLRTDRCPFVDLPTGSSRWGSGVTAKEMRELQWVRPQLVAQIRFVEWTAEGRLRHAKFLALRADKAPKKVHRER